MPHASYHVLSEVNRGYILKVSTHKKSKACLVVGRKKSPRGTSCNYIAPSPTTPHKESPSNIALWESKVDVTVIEAIAMGNVKTGKWVSLQRHGTKFLAFPKIGSPGLKHGLCLWNGTAGEHVYVQVYGPQLLQVNR